MHDIYWEETMKSKLTFLATMTLIGSLGVAVAQSPVPGGASGKTPPLTAEQVSAATNGGQIANGAVSKKAPVPTGWNYFHITYCEALYSSGVWYLFIYPVEGGSWYTTDARFQGMLEPACQTGNWVGFYVFNTNGSYSNVRVYDYK
jgi:hypothetical protein